MADREARLRAKIDEITRLINEINELVEDENSVIYIKAFDKFSDEPNGIHLDDKTLNALYPDAKFNPEPINIFDELYTEINGVRVYAMTDRHAG